MYVVAPVILKYSQDLQTYMAREHRIEGVSVRQWPSGPFCKLIICKETWVTWMHQTLGLIEDTERLIRQMQETGRLVHSFPRCSSIPLEVLQVTAASPQFQALSQCFQATNIIHVLHEVSRTNWGIYSEDIQVRASSLLRRFGYIS